MVHYPYYHMLSKQQPGRRTCLCYRQPKTTAVASWHRTKINKLYDIMKGSTDIVDQRMAFHTSKTNQVKKMDHGSVSQND